MPNNVVREFIIRVNSKGQVEAIRDYEKLDNTLNRTGKSAGAANRELKATAGAAKNATSSFAKQAQGLGGLVHVYATVAANVFALGAAFGVLKRSADLSILRESSKQLSITTGQNFNNIADSLKNITGGAITFREAMQSANLALSGGLSGAQAGKITEIATKAANALGRSVPEAVQRLTQAIVKAEPELADEFGIILRVTEATNKYAKSIGKLPTELSTAQKQQAIFNQFLEQGTEKFANVEIKTNPYDKLAASFIEIGARVTELVRIPIDPFIKLISESGLILASIFALIATKLTTLAIPAITTLTKRIAENASALSIKAQADWVKAQEKVTLANRYAAESFSDYTNILKTGLKNIDFTKLKGIKDGEYINSQILDPDATGQDLINTLKKQLGGDRGIAALSKELESKLKINTGNIVDLRGLKLSINDARLLAEQLSISTSAGARKATLDIKNETGAFQNLGNQIQATTAKAQAFSAQIKAATAGQFSQGLTGGFIDNLKAIPELFNANIKAASGFGAKFAAAMGIGARGLGTLVGGVTKLLGVLGPLGLAASFAITIFGSLTDALGLTSAASEKVSESQDKLTESNELLSKQVEYNKKLNDGTFEGYARQVEHATNLTDGFSESLKEITNILSNLQKANQESFFTRLFGQTGDIDKAIGQVISNIEKQAQTVPEGFRDEFLSVARQLKVDLKAGAGIEFAGTDLNRLKEQLDDPDIIKFTEKGGLVQTLTLEANLDEASRAKLVALVKKIFKEDQAKGLIDAFNNGLLRSKEISDLFMKDVDSRIRDATEALREFGDFADKEIRKIERTNPLIQQLDTILDAIEKQRVAAAGAATAAEPIVPDNAQILLDIDEQQARDFDVAQVAASSLRDAVLENIIVTDTAKASQARYNSELKIQSDLVSKGNISAIKDEYTARSNILREELKVLQATAEEQERIAERQARKGASDEKVTREQIAATKALINSKQDELGLYSEANASLKITAENAKYREKIQSTILGTITAQANVYKEIASITGNNLDIEKTLEFEEKILAAKLAQLKATIASKNAQANEFTGAKRQELLAEANALSIQLGIEKQLSALRVVQAKDKQREDSLQEQIKYQDLLLFKEEQRIKNSIELFTATKNNKFLSSEIRDNASLAELSEARKLAIQEQARAFNQVAIVKAKIANEDEKINDLNATREQIINSTLKKRDLIVEQQRAEVEAESKINEIRTANLNLAELQFELAKKNANLFRDPEQFKELLGEQFRRAAEDFGEALGTTINRVVDITLSTVDAGVDAFVEAVYDGKNALLAAGQAIRDTFLELNKEFIKDTFKQVVRELLKGLFPTFGKSEEVIIAEQQLTQQQITNLKLDSLIAQGQVASVSSGSNLFDANIKDIFSYKGDDKILNSEKELIATFKEGGVQAAMLSRQTADLFSETSNTFLSGINSAVSAMLAGNIGQAATDLGSGVVDLFKAGISLFFAKGGITNGITQRIPMYASGTITNGPEIAMIGEGPTKEAVIPLPDNKSVPVRLYGEPEKKENINTNNVYINITGVQGTEQGLNKSAGQIGKEVHRALAKANRRNS